MAGSCRLVFVDSPTEFYQLRAPQKTVKKEIHEKTKKFREKEYKVLSQTRNKQIR